MFHGSKLSRLSINKLVNYRDKAFTWIEIVIWQGLGRKRGPAENHKKKRCSTSL